MAYNKNLYTSSTDALDAGIIYDTNITKMQSEINTMLNKYMVIIGEATFDEEAVDPQTSQTTQYYDFSPESGSSDIINLVDGDVVLIKFPQAHPFLTTNNNRIWILTNVGYTSYLVSSGDVVADGVYQTHFAFKFNGTFLIPFDINGAQEHYNELKTSLSSVKSDIGIVEDTDTATHAISKGQFVIWKNELYRATSAITIGTTLSSSNLTAVSNGGLNYALAINDASVVVPSNAVVVFNPTSGSSYSGYGGCYYYKIGTTVHVHIGVNGLTPNTNNNIYTMPQGFRPRTSVIAAGTGGSTYTAHAHAQVSDAGNIIVASTDAYAIIDVIYDVF